MFDLFIHAFVCGFNVRYDDLVTQILEGLRTVGDDGEHTVIILSKHIPTYVSIMPTVIFHSTELERKKLLQIKILLSLYN